MRPSQPIALVACLVGAHLLTADAATADDAIFKAIRSGDAAAVQKLVKEDADLNARNEYDDTPLMAAALYADVDVLKLLVEAGADLNGANKAGATALLRAATFEDKVRLLLAKGAEVKARSGLGNTALILAARRYGNSATLRLLLDHGAQVDAANIFGATALMAAVAAEDVDSVRLLLDRGANVNARPNMDGDGFIWGGGRTPLMWAAFVGNERLLELLLERGAKVNEFTLVGSALGQAAWGGHAEVARRLLEAGAQVDRRDLIANYTPLHWAASSERSSPALVELLLARSADVNAEGGQPVDNYLGVAQTPLMLARRRGDTPILHALLKAGAKDVAASAPEPAAKSPDREQSLAESKSAAEAIGRALPLLEKTAEKSVPTFLRHASKQDCVSCHQQQLPLAAISLARSRGFETDAAVTRHQVALLKKDMISATAAGDRGPILEMAQTTFHPEPAIFNGYVSLIFRSEQEPASAATDALVHQLATIQHADGHWSWNLPRPPIQASNITATASAVHMLKFLGIPARRQELTSRLDRARSWLAKAEAETNEERVHQLLGLSWAGEERDALQKLAGIMISEQRRDGGWGQLAGLDSDAYATGQSLYALMEGGFVAADAPPIRKGVDSLLRTQLADGSWHVRTRAHPFQPPMDSGFPHGRDGWISAAATSWAVMALVTSLDPSQTPPPAVAKAAAPAPRVVAPAIGTAEGTVEFARDIQPLLARSCVACHSGERAKAGFRLTDRNSLLGGGNRGEAVVVPGKPDASPLLSFVTDQVEDLEMPPLAKRAKYPALNKDEIAKLNAWIAQGANWPPGVTLGPERK